MPFDSLTRLILLCGCLLSVTALAGESPAELRESDSQQEMLPATVELFDATAPIKRLPDLVISSLSARMIAADRVSYSFTIANIGDAPAALDGPLNAGNLSVQAYISADRIFQNQGDLPAGGTILGRSPLGLLLPGHSVAGKFSATIRGQVADYPHLILMVDWGRMVTESNENNNLAVAVIDGAGKDDAAKPGSGHVLTEGAGTNKDNAENRKANDLTHPKATEEEPRPAIRYPTEGESITEELARKLELQRQGKSSPGLELEIQMLRRGQRSGK